MVVSLVSVLAVNAARAESTGNAGARPGRVTEGTMFWRTVRQPRSEWAEGIYVFSLPEDAAVDHLRMRPPALSASCDIRRSGRILFPEER